jgi:hypothetical protein
MKYYEAALRGYPSADPQDADYDPILLKAYQNLCNINLSPYKERCSKCGQRDYGISYPLTMEFKCRSCLLNDEMNRLHGIPEEEKNYKIYKLRKARKDHDMKVNVTVKPMAKVSMDDLDSVAEFEKFLRSEYEQTLRELEAKNYPFKLDGSMRVF